jgi:hypothetical protein
MDEYIRPMHIGIAALITLIGILVLIFKPF